MSTPTTAQKNGTTPGSSSVTSGANAASSSAASACSSKPTTEPAEVGWLFVPQYYTFVNQNPGRLHCFYTKKSTLVHATEGEDSAPCYGQQQIHNKILSLGFEDCKVYVSNVDSQSSAAGGVIIQVLGEISNKNGPWRKFAQTFFLAEQPNGYFVLNDIFRYLKEEGEEESVAEEAALGTEQPQESAEAVAPSQSQQTSFETATTGVSETPPVAQKSTEVVPEKAAPPAETAAAAIATTNTSAPEPSAAPAQAPAPAAIAQQSNGIANGAPADKEEEKVVEPVTAEAAPEGTPAKAPLAPPSGAPASATAPTTADKPGAPSPAAAPATPKTWAALASNNATKWGAQVAQEAKGVSSAAASTQAAGAPTSSGAATPRSGAAQSAPSAAAAAVLAQQNHPHVFVKNVTEQGCPANTLEQMLSTRFGPVKSCDIVPSKACAFVEFETTASARKAVLASLPVKDGGEGGVRVGSSGHTVTIEEKKKLGERPPPSSRGRGRGLGDGGSFRGGRGARGGPRGRGAPPAAK